MTDIPMTESRTASWIENFTGMFVAPLKTMHELSDLNKDKLTGFGGATLAVVVPCALDGLRMTPPSNLGLSMLTIPTSIMMGLTMWVSLAGLIALLGWIFGAPIANCRRAFVLVGWSFVPWILMGPMYCYRDAMGIWFALFAVIPFAWMFVLQMMAVKVAYGLKSVQMVLLFFGVPAIYFLMQVMQVVQGVYVSITSVL